MVTFNTAVKTQDASVSLAPRPLVSSSLHDETFGNIEDLAGLLIQALMEEGGGTFHMGRHDKPTTGYAVAIPYAEMVLGGYAPMAIVETWLDSVVRPYAGGNCQWVGVWHDTQTGRIYYDAVVVVSDSAFAEELGRKWKQKAIFDIALGEEIRLD